MRNSKVSHSRKVPAKLDAAAKVAVPPDLETRVRAYLKKHPAERWDAAVQAIVRTK
jgi:hypothetical protein